jgi:hypothetical protein
MSPKRTFSGIAEWHLPNRIIYMRDNGMPLSDLFTCLPTRCHSCQVVRDPDQLEVSPQFHLHCLNKKKCDADSPRVKMVDDDVDVEEVLMDSDDDLLEDDDILDDDEEVLE